jgi:hypothetical protein
MLAILDGSDHEQVDLGCFVMHVGSRSNAHGIAIKSTLDRDLISEVE